MPSNVALVPKSPPMTNYIAIRNNIYTIIKSIFNNTIMHTVKWGKCCKGSVAWISHPGRLTAYSSRTSAAATMP